MDLTVLQLLTCLKAAGKETYLENGGEKSSDSAVTSWYISGVHDGKVQLSYKGIKNLWALEYLIKLLNYQNASKSMFLQFHKKYIL